MPVPIADRLRELLLEVSSEETLGCTFVSGGKLHGVGIRSPFYCANCGQSRIWHVVAEGLVTIAAAEDIVRISRASEGGQSV